MERFVSPTIRSTEDRGKIPRLSEIALSPDEIGAWRVEEEFVNAIRGNEPITHTNFEDGVKYMEFTEAVNLSMETGTVVSLPL